MGELMASKEVLVILAVLLLTGGGVFVRLVLWERLFATPAADGDDGVVIHVIGPGATPWHAGGRAVRRVIRKFARPPLARRGALLHAGVLRRLASRLARSLVPARSARENRRRPTLWLHVGAAPDGATIVRARTTALPPHAVLWACPLASLAVPSGPQSAANTLLEAFVRAHAIAAGGFPAGTGSASAPLADALSAGTSEPRLTRRSVEDAWILTAWHRLAHARHTDRVADWKTGWDVLHGTARDAADWQRPRVYAGLQANLAATAAALGAARAGHTRLLEAVSAADAAHGDGCNTVRTLLLQTLKARVLMRLAEREDREQMLGRAEQSLAQASGMAQAPPAIRACALIAAGHHARALASGQPGLGALTDALGQFREAADLAAQCEPIARRALAPAAALGLARTLLELAERGDEVDRAHEATRTARQALARTEADHRSDETNEPIGGADELGLPGDPVAALNLLIAESLAFVGRSEHDPAALDQAVDLARRLAASPSTTSAGEALLSGVGQAPGVVLAGALLARAQHGQRPRDALEAAEWFARARARLPAHAGRQVRRDLSRQEAEALMHAARRQEDIALIDRAIEVARTALGLMEVHAARSRIDLLCQIARAWRNRSACRGGAGLEDLQRSVACWREAIGLVGHGRSDAVAAGLNDELGEALVRIGLESGDVRALGDAAAAFARAAELWSLLDRTRSAARSLARLAHASADLAELGGGDPVARSETQNALDTARRTLARLDANGSNDSVREALDRLEGATRRLAAE